MHNTIAPDPSTGTLTSYKGRFVYPPAGGSIPADTDFKSWGERGKLTAEYFQQIAVESASEKRRLICELAGKLYDSFARPRIDLVRGREDLATWFFEQDTYLSHIVLPCLFPLNLSESDLRAIRLTVTARGEHLKSQILRRLGETEGAKAESPVSAPSANPKSSIAAQRRALIDAYVEEVYRLREKRITRAAIWKAAGYKTRTQCERWERDDPRQTKLVHQHIMRVLREKPHLK
jgi:hypothetical protein